MVSNGAPVPILLVDNGQFKAIQLHPLCNVHRPAILDLDILSFSAGQTRSEGGFAPNRVSAASILDISSETDAKGRKVYKYEILTRTGESPEVRFLISRMHAYQSQSHARISIACILVTMYPDVVNM